MTDEEWNTLLAAIHEEIEWIVDRCGFGEVTVAITDSDDRIRIQPCLSLDFRRDILARVGERVCDGRPEEINSEPVTV